MEHNEEMRGFIQQYIVEPQLLDSDDSKTEDDKIRSEGLKRVIQKEFVKYQVIGSEALKPMIENVDEFRELYEAVSKKHSKETADEIFNEAIQDAINTIAGEFGLASRRKKSYEILAEELDKKYGENSINTNVDRVITKHGGSNIGESCSGGGCGC